MSQNSPASVVLWVDRRTKTPVLALSIPPKIIPTISLSVSLSQTHTLIHTVQQHGLHIIWLRHCPSINVYTSFN